MHRRSAYATGSYVFHVINRAIENNKIFYGDSDYLEFLRLFHDAANRFLVRVLAYALMPNHWHLVLWPTTDAGLSACMQWLSFRHVQKWRARRGSRGRGALYQSRFKAIAVQNDEHFLRLCRYVERNPVRARLVSAADQWEWSSASSLCSAPARPHLSPWPVPKPPEWLELLNSHEPTEVVSEIREAIEKSIHYGDRFWQASTAHSLRWQSGRGTGRHCSYKVPPTCSPELFL
jgi:putative transposase